MMVPLAQWRKIKSPRHTLEIVSVAYGLIEVCHSVFIWQGGLPCALQRGLPHYQKYKVPPLFLSPPEVRDVDLGRDVVRDVAPVRDDQISCPSSSRI